MDILFALVGVGILLLILYIVPVGYNKKGNLYLVGAALLIALTTHYANVTFQWWQGGLILLLLSFLMTILLSRNLENYKLATEGSDLESSSEKGEYDKHFNHFDDDIEEDYSSDLLVEGNSETTFTQPPSAHTSEDPSSMATNQPTAIEDHKQDDVVISELDEEDVDFIEEREIITEEKDRNEQDQTGEDIIEWETIDIKETESIVSPEEELIANRLQGNEEEAMPVKEPHNVSLIHGDEDDGTTVNETDQEEFLNNRDLDDTNSSMEDTYED
ncbi:hypothetical protein GLW05_06730 [Pontibacillus yanchengensis]|uniref:Uncharacterized protein n=1 Tax=Pontibacillus yanchengensis TaxID=462910 RepID=A0A6I4ZVY6_9BACI|nr:hypothetical protein [Pontibacillus yanchengensis]MYL33294.1 hypothetical protein [Pontibacillus yanchengensis]